MTDIYPIASMDHEPRWLIGNNSEHIRVRQAGCFDWRDLSLLMGAIFPELTASSASYIIRHNRAMIGVVESCDRLLGFYQFQHGSVTAWLTYIGVDKSCRGAGIGDVLLRGFEAHAVALGFSRVDLDVYSHNDRAIRFYEKCGYLRQHVHEDKGIVKLRYAKSLSGSGTGDCACKAKTDPLSSLLETVYWRCIYMLLVDLPVAVSLWRRRATRHVTKE